MAIPRATSGNNSQFTYDFGITIAQSTVNKLVRLTGATLTLASAYYALRTNAEKYVDTLRENSLRFGGILSPMKAMDAAQKAEQANQKEILEAYLQTNPTAI